MVTDWVISLATSVVTALFGWITLPDVPSWVAQAGDYVGAIGSYLTGTGAWIPWGLIAAVIGAWAAVMAAMVLIKGVRIVASFLTLGGGSAA